jgi:hypothetical protein
MVLPQMPERLLVSVSGTFNEFSLAGRHAYPASVAIVHPKAGKRFPAFLHQRILSHPSLLAEEFTSCNPSRREEMPMLPFLFHFQQLT